MSKLGKSIFGGAEEEAEQMEISAPYNFKHVAHARPDPHSSTGFSVSSILESLLQIALLKDYYRAYLHL